MLKKIGKIYLKKVRNNNKIIQSDFTLNLKSMCMYSNNKIIKDIKTQKNPSSANKQLSKMNKPQNSTATEKTSKQKNYKPVLSQQQRNQLLFQQKLKNTYNQLQSLPSDSYDTVVQNFRRIKTKLMDRRVYIPNKPEIMQKIDKSLQLVKQHHTVWRAPSTAPDRLRSDNRQQIIEWELEQAQKKFYLSLLENEKFLAGMALSVIILMGGLEYYFFVREEDTRRKAPKMFL